MKTFTILYMENDQEMGISSRDFFCGQGYEVIWRTGLSPRSNKNIETIRGIGYRVRT
ncbi:hypothetical protein V4V36_20475 [Paenibacillus lautus]|uniref:hypothetical protein n=1 Tax=Paenibacillus lautus TaxID=1401 RepID=UPI002FBD46E9